jgi:hypothetical protein
MRPEHEWEGSGRRGAWSLNVKATIFRKDEAVNRESGQDPFAGLKSGGEEYSVYDAHYERIGRVDDVFLDERDAVTYIGVEMGFFGTNSTLVPAEIVRVNDRRRLIEVAAEAETIKHAPHFGNEETVSPELEDRVRTYFGLEPLLPPSDPYPPEDTARFGPDDRVDTEPGERMEAQNRQSGLAGEPVAGGRVPENRWDRETTADDVTIHRRRK